MTDDATDSQTEPEHREDLSARAHDLIGTDKLWSEQLLYTSVQLGIIDLLGDEPIPAGMVADELDLDADSFYRVLRSLSHFGVFEEDHDRRFNE